MSELPPNPNFKKSLADACESAVKLFGASHATYLDLLPGKEAGIILAESHSEKIHAIDLRIQIRGIPLEEELFEKSTPIFVLNVSEEPRLGVVGVQLASIGVRSLLLIPVKGNDDCPIGSFSLDWDHICQNPPQPDDPRCEVFAKLVGLAIKAYHLQNLQDRRRALFESLDQFVAHLQEENDLPRLHQDIVRFAVEMLDASGAALYENHPVLQKLSFLIEHRSCSSPEQILYDAKHIAALAAVSGRTQLSSLGSEFYPSTFASAAAVPVRILGLVRYVILVGRNAANRPFTEPEADALERYGARAGQAISKLSVRSDSSNRPDWAAVLNELSTFMQSQQDAPQGEALILFAFLTGVTAHFGLRFNRASVLLYDDPDHLLVHALSIGQMTDESWRQACDSSKRLKFDDLPSILQASETLIADPSELQKHMFDFRHQLRYDGNEILLKVLTSGLAEIVSVDQLPQDFCADFQPANSVAIAPLRSANKSIGIVVADNKFTGAPISNADLEALCVFGATAASSLASLHANLVRKESAERLREMLKGLRAFDTSLGLREVLKHIAVAACQSTRATGASIILSADGHRAWLQVPAGAEPAFDPDVVMREDGFSSKVMESRKPEPIPDIAAHRDQMNSKTSAARYQSSICLPLTIRSRCIGVLWLLYAERQSFPQDHIDDLQTYADGVAAAYDNALRRAELESLRAAALALSQPDRLKQELESVPTEAMRLTKADGATFWSYDLNHQQFTSRVSDGFGQDDMEWPSPDGISMGLLTKGYLAQEKIPIWRPEHFYEVARNRDIQAFQGVCVRIGQEPIGVLYVVYRQARPFDQDDRQQLESFAALNAPLLKAARVLKQSQVFQKAAEGISQPSSTPENIVRSIREAYECGPVLLYLFEPGTRRIVFPPSMHGVKDEDAVKNEDRSQLEAMLPDLFSRDKPYVAQNISQQKRLNQDGATIFDGTLFTRREGTHSCAAFPLRVGRHELGILFVNHTAQQEFSSEELATLEVFAKHAALSILPDRLFQLSATVLNGVVHEIARPFTNVKRTLEFMVRGHHGPLNESQSQEIKSGLLYVREVERAMRRFSALPHLITGTPKLKRVRLCPDLLNEIVDDFRKLVQPRLRFHCDLDQHKALELVTDPFLLENIVLNLLSNAEKYTKEGSITLQLVPSHAHLEISVADTGLGIPPTEREKIFDLGFRCSNVKGTVGTGIGLFLSRECATILGGNIDAFPQSAGAGTDFRLRIATGAENELSKASSAN